MRATLLAHLGRRDESTADVETALAEAPEPSRLDVVLEAADVIGAYGDPRAALELMGDLMRNTGGVPPPAANAIRMIAAHNLIRAGRRDEARAMLDRIDDDQLMPLPGARSRIASIRAHLAAASAENGAHQQALEAAEFGRATGALFWARYADAIAELTGTRDTTSRAVARLAHSDPGSLCLVSDLVASMLGDIDPPEALGLDNALQGFEARWRCSLRIVVDSRVSKNTLPAALWLDRIGEAQDISRLRSVARRLGARGQGSDLGRSLARRLAPRVFVEDQGRVEVRIGARLVPGTSLRRKVLALLCFLLSRSDLAATREQTLEALWPDLDPELGSNSLNQTVYFLRRVLEPQYTDDTSPGYIQSDSEMVWLDGALTSSRSRICAALLRDARLGDGAAVDELGYEYRGRFALDFAYEEWAATHRDSLHTQYLETMERAVAGRTAAGDFAGAIELARRVMDVDSEADAVELALIRLYRSTGAHSAAAELYARYAAVQRSEYGAEVPPLNEL